MSPATDVVVPDLRGFGESDKYPADDDLGDALYAIESDPAHNPFADDVPETLKSLKAAGVRLRIVSDIVFDLRPAFADAGGSRG